MYSRWSMQTTLQIASTEANMHELNADSESSKLFSTVVKVHVSEVAI